MPPSRRRGLTAAVAALVVLTATGPAASADVTATPPSPIATAAVGPAIVRTVTLITGDKVTVTVSGGRHSVTSVVDPQGRTGGAHVMSVGDDIYVYPDAASPFIASGALDEHLFNVTELLADGYDDARSDHLPLIVTYTDAAARSRSLKTLRGRAGPWP